VTIPSDGSGWDGTAVVAVTARDASQDSDDPGGTLDNDGDGAADGTNRMIRNDLEFRDTLTPVLLSNEGFQACRQLGGECERGKKNHRSYVHVCACVSA
jgi:hypothetical protein